MSQQTSPVTPKQFYAAAATQPAAVTNAPHSGICTRAMANKMTLNAAAASLHAAKVPTKPRTYTASSVMAAARALIARTQGVNTPAIETPSSNTKVDMHVAKTPLPNMKVATPRTAEVSRPDCTTSVLTVGAITLEEQMQEMRRMLEKVLKDNEEQNYKLGELREEVNKHHGRKKREEDNMASPVEVDDANKIVPADVIKNTSDAQSEKQLHLLIANKVKSQLSGSSSRSARYTKPYSKRINDLRLPQGYQPPKFQQFDSRGNSRQHVAHFVETCNNAGTQGDLLVKQFVRSLKGIAFDWYTDLEAESIDSWGQMEDEFFNQFYSTRRIVSMSELTNTKQLEEEPVVHYINRWRALCLECKDRISEASAIEMCIDGMNWELLYILKGNKPRNFQELATRAHDMEITVREHGCSNTLSLKAFREMEHEKIDKASQSLPEEVMVVPTNNASHKKDTTKDFDLSNGDDAVETNHITTRMCNNPLQKSREGWGQKIQFGNLPPIEVCVRKPLNYPKSKILELHDAPQNSQEADNAEEWTVVARKKPRKHRRLQTQTVPIRRKCWGNTRPIHLEGKKKPKKGIGSQMLPVYLLDQIPPAPISLGDFFPEGFLNKLAVNTTSGAINNSNKGELDDKVPNTKCTNRPPIQWRKGRVKSRI